MLDPIIKSQAAHMQLSHKFWENFEKICYFCLKTWISLGGQACSSSPCPTHSWLSDAGTLISQTCMPRDGTLGTNLNKYHSWILVQHSRKKKGFIMFAYEDWDAWIEPTGLKSGWAQPISKLSGPKIWDSSTQLSAHFREKMNPCTQMLFLFLRFKPVFQAYISIHSCMCV